MQRNCIFPWRYALLTYYDWLRGHPSNTLMARNSREICNFLATPDVPRDPSTDPARPCLTDGNRCIQLGMVVGV